MHKVLLKDRLEFLYGFSVRVNAEPDGKYPVYGSNGITGFIDNFKVEGPGVIIGRKGSIGAVHFSENNFTPTDTAYYLYLKDKKKDDIRFWYYYLQLLNLKRLNTHSSVPGLNREVAYFIPINPPELSIQKKIAVTLGVLDEKIELNNRINNELETMAKTLYDYWFVQFDFPDENGKPYKSSGGKMVWNEELKREIPEGWRLLPIREILSAGFAANKVPSTKFLKYGNIPIIDQSADYISGFTNDNESLIRVNEPVIVFGDHTRIIKLVNFNFARGADGTQILSSKIKEVPQYYFYFSLLKIDLSNYGYARHFKFLKESKIIVPIDEAKKFETLMSASYEIIKHNIFENQKLAELRDWLLPMLMNGQVTVK